MGIASGWYGAPPSGWEDDLARALTEDIGNGDLTAGSLGNAQARWYIEAQAHGVLCGVTIAQAALSPAEILLSDGEPVHPGQRVLVGEGPAAAALTHERTALNFLMHLGGVATLTRQYVEAVAGTGATIIDTRKTTPGLRNLEKYAVRCGGGRNHRQGLFDGVLIKDNHIEAAGSIAEAVRNARAHVHHLLRIEVECESPEMVEQAIEAGAEVVLLDNMSPCIMKSVIERFRGRAVFEASGGISLATVREIAETGVDVISVGAITHSAPALSFHMEVE